jgi:hypothetical protein
LIRPGRILKADYNQNKPNYLQTRANFAPRLFGGVPNPVIVGGADDTYNEVVSACWMQ